MLTTRPARFLCALVVSLAVGSTGLVTSATASVPGGAAILSTAKSTYVRGEGVTFTLTVVTHPKTVRATGTAVFTIDGNPTAPVIVSSGKATYKTTTLAVGEHTATANYSGDAKYAPATAGPVTVEVTKGSTTTTATSLRTPIPTGTRARINSRAKTVAPAKAPLTGLTTFSASNGVDAPVTASVATNSVGTALWQPLLPDGSWTVTSSFDGNDDLLGSTSAPLSIQVGPNQNELLKDQDNSETLTNGSRNVINLQGVKFDLMQSFTPAISGDLERIDVLMNYSGPTSYLTVTIQPVSGGVPTGTILATETFSPSVVTNPAGMNTLTFTTPATVVAGTQYAVVFEVLDAVEDSEWLFANTANTYAGGAEGQRLSYQGWWNILDNDMAFTTWVRTP